MKAHNKKRKNKNTTKSRIHITGFQMYRSSKPRSLTYTVRGEVVQFKDRRYIINVML